MVFGREIMDKFEREDCNAFGINTHYIEKRELYHGWAMDCFGNELTEQLDSKTFEEIEKFLIARSAGKILGRSKTPLDPDFTKLLKQHKAMGTPIETHLRELIGMVAVEDGKKKVANAK